MYSYSITGAWIEGTSDVMHVTALTISDSFSLAPDGSVKIEFSGDTDINWDSQCTIKNCAGKRLFVDSNGDEWAEDEIIVYGDGESLPFRASMHESDGQKRWVVMNDEMESFVVASARDAAIAIRSCIARLEEEAAVIAPSRESHHANP
jgi:hypothetical protein